MFKLPPPPTAATPDDGRLFLAPWLDHVARTDPAAFEKLRPAVEVAAREGRIVERFTPAQVEAEVARVLAAGAPRLAQADVEAWSSAERAQRWPEVVASQRARTFVPLRYGSRPNDRPDLDDPKRAGWSLRDLEVEERGPPSEKPRPVHYEPDLAALPAEERARVLVDVNAGRADLVPAQAGRRTAIERIRAAQAEHDRHVAEWRRVTGAPVKPAAPTPSVERLTAAELGALLNDGGRTS